MNIVLGSTSTRKKEILQKALEGKFAYWGIEGVEARPEVSEQPLSIEETIQGATNRAKNTLVKQPKAGLAIGMQDGLESIGGIYNLVCAVAFWDGERLIVGQSGHLQLPKAVSDKIKAGGKFGELIREYQKTAPPEEEERIKQLISREISFISAINDALTQLRVKPMNSVVATTASQVKSTLLASKLLKLSAVSYWIYFGFGSMLIFISRYAIRPDVHYNINIVFLLILVLNALALALLSSSSRVKSDKKLLQNLLLAFGLFGLLALTQFLLLWHMQPMKKDLNWAAWPLWLPIVNLLGLIAFGILGYWLSQLKRNSKPSMATVVFLLIGVFGVIANLWMFAGYKDFSLISTPILLLGVFWGIGIWRLNFELIEAPIEHTSNVSAFYKLDKS